MVDDPDRDELSVVEENVSVQTRKISNGRVRIAVRTEEIDHILPAEVSSVDVDVVRVTVGRRIETVPEVVTDGDVTIIPVVEERLVVTRELYLKEEIHVRRIERTDTVEVEATSRRQTAQIERLSAGQAHSHEKDNQDDL